MLTPCSASWRPEQLAQTKLKKLPHCQSMYTVSFQPYEQAVVSQNTVTLTNLACKVSARFHSDGHNTVVHMGRKPQNTATFDQILHFWELLYPHPSPIGVKIWHVIVDLWCVQARFYLDWIPSM